MYQVTIRKTLGINRNMTVRHLNNLKDWPYIHGAK